MRRSGPGRAGAGGLGLEKPIYMLDGLMFGEKLAEAESRPAELIARAPAPKRKENSVWRLPNQREQSDLSAAKKTPMQRLEAEDTKIITELNSHPAMKSRCAGDAWGNKSTERSVGEHHSICKHDGRSKNRSLHQKAKLRNASKGPK